jgi:hypothetical protein
MVPEGFANDILGECVSRANQKGLDAQQLGPEGDAPWIALG